MAMNIQIVGDKALIATFGELTKPRLRAAIVKASKTTMIPTLATAKQNVPVRTGRLRASLALHATTARQASRQGMAGVAIWPSNDFSFDAPDGTAQFVARSKKKAAKFLKRGLVSAGGTSPWEYAHIVETGMTRNGVRRQTASWYLRRALESNTPRMISEFQPAIFSEIAAAKARFAAKR
jgi:hypothetical protein